MELNMTTILTVIEQKWRFPSNHGPLTFETLFDLPLTGNDNTNLDQVAILINDEINAKKSETSFVNPSLKSKFDIEKLETMLEIVKYIIEQKQTAKEEKRQRTNAMRKRESLEKMLAQKQLENLSNMSVDEIQQELASIEE
jgi:hypothetical protein